MRRATIVLMMLLALTGACAKKKLATAASAPPPPAATVPAPAPPPPARPAERVEESIPVPAIAEDTIGNRSLEDLNRDSPFRPAFFGLDSSELDDAGRAIVSANADIMKKYPTWVVTIEGHCDERGTAEYNLALGERRAVAVNPLGDGLHPRFDLVRFLQETERESSLQSDTILMVNAAVRENEFDGLLHFLLRRQVGKVNRPGEDFSGPVRSGFGLRIGARPARPIRAYGARGAAARQARVRRPRAHQAQ